MHSTHLPLREHSIPRGRDGRKGGGEEREALTAGFGKDRRKGLLSPPSNSLFLPICTAVRLRADGMWGAHLHLGFLLTDRYEHMPVNYEWFIEARTSSVRMCMHVCVCVDRDLCLLLKDVDNPAGDESWPSVASRLRIPARPKVCVHVYPCVKTGQQQGDCCESVCEEGKRFQSEICNKVDSQMLKFHYKPLLFDCRSIPDVF